MILLGDARGSRQALTRLLTSSPEEAQLKSGSEHSGEASSFAQAEWWAGSGCSAELTGCLLVGTASRGLQGGETAKRCKTLEQSQPGRNPHPLTLAKTETFGDPEDQNKESKKKRAKKVFTLCKNQRPQKSLPGTNPKFLNGLGVGLGVLAQYLQLTPTNLELSIRRNSERELESAGNEIPSLISHAGSSTGFYSNNSNRSPETSYKTYKHPTQSCSACEFMWYEMFR